MELKQINTKHPLYQAAVTLRIALFFKDRPDAAHLIADALEAEGQHVVCITNAKVIGTGRVNVIDGEGIISQMAVAEDAQRQGVGQHILEYCIALCKAQDVRRITLAARCTAVAFYEKYGFKAYGTVYPSKKTGIEHQRMML